MNGIPALASPQLLHDILRKDWGFECAVVGDMDNVADVWSGGGHKYAKDAPEASGNDLCRGRTYEALSEALKRGLITEANIDTALRRLFTLRFLFGQFDPPDRVAYRNISAAKLHRSSVTTLPLSRKSCRVRASRGFDWFSIP